MNYDNKIIDDLLAGFEPVIGADFDKYKNHVYRVFLNCKLLDPAVENEEKYAITAVFHDIGIWTNHTIDYLDPSIEQAEIFLLQSGRPELIKEISAMIYWHHKISPYRGNHRKTVETFRKADWTDVTFGLLNFGSDRRQISNYKRIKPYVGFHRFLIRKVAANFLRHPFDPLPMFTS